MKRTRLIIIIFLILFAAYIHSKELKIIKATASSFEGPVYKPEYSIDNNIQTRWSSRYTDTQWIVFDLGKKESFNMVTIIWEAAYGKEYNLQISDNNRDWETVYKKRNGDGEEDTVILGNQKARYIRVYGIKRATVYGYSVYEFKVYLKVDSKIPPPPIEVKAKTRYYSIYLSWGGNTKDIYGYDIYRSIQQEEKYEKINTDIIQVNRYTDDNINYGKKYSYYIKTVSYTGIESIPSQKVSASIMNIRKDDFIKEEDLPIFASLVSPSILGVYIKDGTIVHGNQIPYKEQEGDKIEIDKWINTVRRDGKRIGAPVGRTGEKMNKLRTFDTIINKIPEEKEQFLRKSSFCLISSKDDPNYKNPKILKKAGFKTKPTDMGKAASISYIVAKTHTMYLTLPKALKEEKTYTVHFKDNMLPSYTFKYHSKKMRSEAIHVTQVGFRPDDPAKVGFLSVWLGDMGAYAYPEGLEFHLLNEENEFVYKGKIKISLRAENIEDNNLLVPEFNNRNYNLTDVYYMDFSDFKAPGTYRIYVEGIGTSYPFEIGEDVWQKAFKISMKGLYHMRSGIELGPPYTEYRRPRCFHPDDGVIIYQSTFSLLDFFLNDQAFKKLVEGRTEEIVGENAWGGYFDAGDWDRRINHLIDATILHLELLEMFPEYFENIDLNIPESDNDMPDLADEAMWNIDFYKRLQMPDGGIRGGIESAEHPKWGEGSWQESRLIMAYAPDIWSSCLYAGAAVRLARYLKSRKPELSEEYFRSALKAMQWAEKNYINNKYLWWYEIREARNYAASELYRYTGDEIWHDIFKKTCVLRNPNMALIQRQAFGNREHWDQSNASFVYLTTEHPGVDKDLKNTIKKIYIKTAEKGLAFSKKTGFKWLAKKDFATPIFYGVMNGQDLMPYIRAYHLTKNPEYLKMIQLSMQYPTGANPMNMCLTTGVGENPVKNPFIADIVQAVYQPSPAGISVYGPMDLKWFGDEFPLPQISDNIYPYYKEWPVMESYFDLNNVFLMNEYVVGTLGHVQYIWGFLAARK
ncbi:MAG: glycoside hydrolase family 9 protein [Elusimicrobia bacterium]|nr:glycoside hydrolase family 9 protein [Elusimicrobiota bacterium]